MSEAHREEKKKIKSQIASTNLHLYNLHLDLCKINLNIKLSLWTFFRSMPKFCTSIALRKKISLSIVVCLNCFSTCAICSCRDCSLSSLSNIICFTSYCTSTFRSRFLGRTSIKLGFNFDSKLVSIINLVWILKSHLILNAQFEIIDVTTNLLGCSFNHIASQCQFDRNLAYTTS